MPGTGVAIVRLIKLEVVSVGVVGSPRDEYIDVPQDGLGIGQAVYLFHLSNNRVVFAVEEEGRLCTGGIGSVFILDKVSLCVYECKLVKGDIPPPFSGSFWDRRCEGIPVVSGEISIEWLFACFLNRLSCCADFLY